MEVNFFYLKYSIVGRKSGEPKSIGIDRSLVSWDRPIGNLF